MHSVLAAPGRCAVHVRDLLAAEGLEPRVDPECLQGVHFAWEGYPHFVQVDEADPDFVQVCVGYLLAESARDELRLLRTANGVQGQAKVVKVLVPPGLEYVGFQAELFLDGRPLTPSLFRRTLGALRAAVDDFFGKRRDQAPVARA